MTAPRPRLRDRLCVAGFSIFWLVPVLIHGLYRAPLPWEPALLHHWHDIACLFPERPRAWNNYYVEVRRAGRLSWEEHDEGLDFVLEPFGHRTRLHRYLLAWGPDRGLGREEVARFLVARDRARHPDAAPIVALRFVWTWSAPKPDEPPEGAWRRPPLAEIPPNRRRILSHHPFGADEEAR